MRIEDELYSYLPIYASLPNSLRYIAGYLYRLIPLRARYGRKYQEYIRLVKKEKNLTKEQIQDYQIMRLRELVSYAVENVPYYQRTFGDVSVEISSFEDFQKLPLLTKKEVRDSTEILLSKRYSKDDLLNLSTSGSTGEPLLLYYEKGSVSTREFVYINDLWSRIGYKPSDKLALFRSALIRGRKNLRLWEYEPVKNRWIYSAYDLAPSNMARIVSHLRRTKPDFLHVYPSVLTILANYMKQNNEPPINSIRGILSGSENTYPSQIKLFEAVFQCPVLRWYGLGELSALAGSCEYSHNYHCYATYSYVELVDEEGNQVKEIGKRGEIVGTTLDNYSMPLIRYRTGDYAIYGGDYCEKCGRIGMLFEEIEGRAQERIIDKHGNVHSLGPYIFGIHEETWSKISAIQFYQQEEGKLKLFIVSNHLGHDKAKEYVSSLFLKRFRNNFEIEILPVESIERTASGKHKYLIQELNVD